MRWGPTGARGGHLNDGWPVIRFNEGANSNPSSRLNTREECLRALSSTMHSKSVSSETLPMKRPFWVRAGAHLTMLAAFALMLGLLAPIARAQVFLAEIADNDIGRIGP